MGTAHLDVAKRSALDLAQQDKYEARALFTLAETLRFTITRNAPSMDKQASLGF